jgi:hypothetical protein
LRDEPEPDPKRKAEHDAFARLVRVKVGLLVVCGAILFVVDRLFG